MNGIEKTIVVSFVCVYNNQEMYDTVLRDSLKKQKCKYSYELIGINNKDNKFPSAASALNSGAKKAKGTYIVFIHQDIEFLGVYSLEALIEELNILQDGDIFGIAGEKMEKNGEHNMYTSMRFGEWKKTYPAIPVDKPVTVAAIDECLFGMTRETWAKRNLNEVICDNWHFYAVEYCCHVRKNNNHVYVLNSMINHLSRAGTLSKSYFKSLERLCEHYQNDFDIILSTTACISLDHYKINIKKMECSHLRAKLRKKLKL